jgi:ubiquinone/menaquinone biosynthesis C-methylase UbiE
VPVSDSIRFDNGAAYERYMGRWSQLVGDRFLDWLAPAPGLRWLDVGCGNGAFTESFVARCAPTAVTGIDPSEQQLAYARARPALQLAQLLKADAMALPFPNDSFDIAVMPLVIFFVPEPARGVAEMARVVAPGGIVAAYSWDMVGGGFPYHALREELQAMGAVTPEEPSRDASRPEVMQQLWQDAGLADIASRTITVERTFADFDEYWAIVQGGPSLSRTLAALSPQDSSLLQSRMRKRLTPDAIGRVTYSARANAISGRMR